MSSDVLTRIAASGTRADIEALLATHDGIAQIGRALSDHAGDAAAERCRRAVRILREKRKPVLSASFLDEAPEMVRLGMLGQGRSLLVALEYGGHGPAARKELGFVISGAVSERFLGRSRAAQATATRAPLPRTDTVPDQPVTRTRDTPSPARPPASAPRSDQTTAGALSSLKDATTRHASALPADMAGQTEQHGSARTTGPASRPEQAANGARNAWRDEIAAIGTCYTAQVFAPAAHPAAGAGIMRLPASLLPPPCEPPAADVQSHADALVSWLNGVPWSDTAFALRAHVIDKASSEDLMEIESELHVATSAITQTYGAQPPVASGADDAQWCARLGRDIGRFDHSCQRAVDIFATRLALALRASGRPVAPLEAAGADIVVPEAFADALAGFLDAEAEYIADGPGETSGPAPDIRGSVSPRNDLGTPFCLDRAIFLHVSARTPMGTAMSQALWELRHAQATRLSPDLSLSEFEARYAMDPAAYLADLAGQHEPVAASMPVM